MHPQLKIDKIRSYIDRILEKRKTKITREEILKRLMTNDYMSDMIMNVQECYEKGVSLTKSEIRVHDLYRKKLLLLTLNINSLKKQQQQQQQTNIR